MEVGGATAMTHSRVTTRCFFHFCPYFLQERGSFLFPASTDLIGSSAIRFLDEPYKIASA